MNQIVLKIPNFAFIIATRAALGAGVGLLIANKLSRSQRTTIGKALITIGAATTVPALLFIRRGAHRSHHELKPGVRQDDRLTGSTRFPRGADDEFVSA
jgi:hypothetical protein